MAEAGEDAALIEAKIASLADWRGEMLAEVRAVFLAADPGVIETWKWRGVPVWECSGILSTGETYREVVKLTFAKGAALEDRHHLFNASLTGGTRRAIDLRQGDRLNPEALTDLIRQAIALNKQKAGH